ncbi:TonB family protein [Pyxidicoccus sp. MSG2]|uniref:TonB family protein n=1 Tax=Pyxidicoccus sp. MSG2 TaxID=2996790 RepID=UPI00226DB38E|nr:TonB family protein [Pyxidicoccus sp. MSG2]MCY1017422.1 TonB family protein [Pyxidicoccus sp. MSG2]
MPDSGAKAGGHEGALFASVVHSRARQARDRQRALWLLPLALGFHALVLVGLTTAWHGDPGARAHATVDSGDLVLRLVPAPPPPPASTATSAPSNVARKTVARRPRPFPKPTLPTPGPAPVASPTPPAEEAPPPTPDTADKGGTDVAAAAPAGMPGGIAGGVVGGLVRGVLGASNPGLVLSPPPRPTEQQLATWREQYFETMFRDRFENVRYPHQAAMAGIQGRLVVRISVGARGQILDLGVLGYCPHYVLCDAAMKAVRDAAPFPPPPPELGGRVTVELPFNYHLR